MIDASTMMIDDYERAVWDSRWDSGTASILRSLSSGLDLPNHRAAGGILDMVSLPFLIPEHRTEPADIVHPLGSMSRLLRSVAGPRWPAIEVHRDLTGRPLAHPVNPSTKQAKCSLS